MVVASDSDYMRSVITLSNSWNRYTVDGANSYFRYGSSDGDLVEGHYHGNYYDYRQSSYGENEVWSYNKWFYQSYQAGYAYSYHQPYYTSSYYPVYSYHNHYAHQTNLVSMDLPLKSESHNKFLTILFIILVTVSLIYFELRRRSKRSRQDYLY